MTNDQTRGNSSYDEVIRQLVTEREFSRLDFHEALTFFCRTLSNMLAAPRVGIWAFEEGGDALRLLCLFDSITGEVKSEGWLTQDQARTYLDAVATDYVLEISDAMNDSRCVELAKEYLPKNNIAAMLDCPIRTFGGLAGVVCIEHINTTRQWTRPEIDFAVAVTGLVSLTMEHQERLAAEASATEQEDRLKIYTELATDWYWQTDADFTFTMVEGPEALDGQIPAEYVGQKLWEVPLLSPQDGGWEYLQARIAEHKRLYDYVVRATHPDGKEYYAELAGVPRFDTNGDFVGYKGTAKDVTARMRQSQELERVFLENHALMQQLQLVFERCGIGVFRYDGAKKTLTYDNSFLKLYGFDADTSIEPGDFARLRVHPDDQPGMQKFISDSINSRETQGSHFFRALWPDGRQRYMRSFWKQDTTVSNGAKNNIGLHIDVTDVVTAQKDRANALEHIAAIADNVPGAIYEVTWKDDDMTDLVYVSPKCLDLTGRSQDEFRLNPKLILETGNSSNEDLVSAAIRRSITTGSQQSHREKIELPDGRTHWVEHVVRAVAQPNGGYRVFGILMDITGVVVAQEEAELQTSLAHRAQKNESIGQLTGGVAHDFNNLLAIIMGNLELLREQIDDEVLIEMADAGIRASQRGADLSRSLLAFARKTQLEPEIVDLNDVARQAQNWMRRALPESIQVETSLLAGLWPTRLDQSLIESSLLNLILNARDAMGGHGKLTIETANTRIDEAYIDSRKEELPPGRYVMLAVSDTGSGMDAETMAQIFEPFYTTKPPGSGSGLGLSMVQGFVKQSGGTVQVYSEIGVGTTFKLYFSAEHHGSGRVFTPEIEKQVEQTNSARILLVEDDDGVRAMLRTILKRANYTVVSAPSGDDAYKLFQNDSNFDLVVTDIVMPGELQGTQLAKLIRKDQMEIPFIFLSGYAAEATVHGNGLRPEDLRIMKPVPKAELLSAVSRLLSKRAPNE
ncbi:PAS domain S-box protein [Antarctobacter jejuensis]|uniref:PAS domain S-box protein n=1 Tax=Antarctobacter jejuensis TaxID=1439938 RepID=UPI003FD1FBE7